MSPIRKPKITKAESGQGTTRTQIGATVALQDLDGSFRLESKSDTKGHDWYAVPTSGQRLDLLELWELGYTGRVANGLVYMIEFPTEKIVK